ncbi:hypothetical protein G6F61_015218 [Rhizopus arrhizus]|nr:hypothetical protein G6F61_015218 [Rhizopus arrhizus]
MQLVFQDPSTSLNPRHPVFEAIAEPLIVHGWNAGRDALRRRVAELIDAGVLQTTLGEPFGRIAAANLRRAHALLESHRAKGKIVLEGW